jgi:hypothetical protein
MANNMKNGVNIFVILNADRDEYVASYGIAGVQWTDNVTVAHRFDTYNEAERVVDEEGCPPALYRIDELLVRD